MRCWEGEDEGNQQRPARWWQLKYFLFSSLPGEDSHFDSYFSNGLVQPPTSLAFLRVNVT